MANKLTIQHKRSSVAGNKPNISNIAVGELAINFADEIVYTRTAADQIIPLLSNGGSNWTIETSGISRADRIKVGANADPIAAYDINGTVAQNVQDVTGACDVSTGQYFHIDAQFPVSVALSGTIANATTLALFLKNGAASTSAVTWDSKILWETGTAPVLTGSGSNDPGYDVISLVTFDGGANWIGQSFCQHTGNNLFVTTTANTEFFEAYPVTYVDGIAGTGGTIDLSTTLFQSGDFVIISYASDTVDSPNAPAGFTRIFNDTGSTPDSAVYSGFPSSTTINAGFSTSSAWTASIFRNVDTTSPFDATITSATGSAGTPNPGSVTTSTDGAMIVISGMLDDDIVNGSAPAGYTLSAAGNYGTFVSGASIMTAYKVMTTAGTDNPGLFGGGGSDDWVSTILALKPDPSNTYSVWRDVTTTTEITL